MDLGCKILALVQTSAHNDLLLLCMVIGTLITSSIDACVSSAAKILRFNYSSLLLALLHLTMLRITTIIII